MLRGKVQTQLMQKNDISKHTGLLFELKIGLNRNNAIVLDYGDKIINHNNIAKLWSAYLDINISAHDVAICMTLLKIARTKLGSRASDTYIDAAAYMAIAGECKEKEVK